eukprot:CAMPEP_0118995160 /NCGR_PEP_ID=MMETSP1173-20130426/58031_1 /TAXON_ID=1034831 /ORGANISM="Rhizochromulina marina cf, Strain CCMP1243" /LENGTH=369 /DNA_ID=CAMNT_0006946489 /DNA_START=126 /DNA_END=1235 /DNA_ORIENTATION=-
MPRLLVCWAWALVAALCCGTSDAFQQPVRRATALRMVASKEASSASSSPPAQTPPLSRSSTEELMKPAEPSRESAVLEAAYVQCEKITSVFAKTFYLGTKLMSEKQRRAVWAIYVWCRRTDDLVDGPRAMMNSNVMRADLAAWEARLYQIWEGKPQDSLDLALLDTKHLYPTLPIEPFCDMIQGMVMDTPDLGQDRYETWDDLYLYCYRVASTVGLMTLPVLGTAEGFTEEDAKGPAIALGIALQITNILRDVGEDAVRGRIYLPKEDLDKFGVSETQILNGVIDENYKNLVKFEIQRARDYYKEAERGVAMLAPSSRLSVQAAADMYGKILEKLEENDYDNFRKRAYVSKPEKFLSLPQSWMKVNAMN